MSTTEAMTPVDVKPNWFVKQRAKKALKLKERVTLEMHVLYLNLFNEPLPLVEGEQVKKFFFKVVDNILIINIEGDAGNLTQFSSRAATPAQRVLVMVHLQKFYDEIKPERYVTLKFALFYENDTFHYVDQFR